MQQTPFRLSQTIWSTFRASKPVPRLATRRSIQLQPQTSRWLLRESIFVRQVRSYSDRQEEIDKKAREARSRIEDALDARSEAAAQPDSKLRNRRDETIVHTNPEASSIVHTSPWHGDALSDPKLSSKSTTGPLPSGKPSHLSPVRQRFSSFMDNFQTHIFSASRRLNDLTGYSGIEALKSEIAAQESFVFSSRRAVKDARARYAAAITTRSTTQREVNDLLQRKHAWTPEDLERFTSLYRNDHANEQSESASQKEVADAEAQYEEASTKLARTILARYHEEQIWSDKIRQMSTWGTWGLMGLNVLLFVVFQIAIEPWRRSRLVKGFEEKVEMALKERDESVTRLLVYGADAVVRPNADGTVTSSESTTAVEAGTKLDGLADHIVEQIVDAVSGTSSSGEEHTQASGAQDPAETPNQAHSAFASRASGYAYYQEAFRELFSERTLVVTQKEMTAVALEGAVGGAALMGLLLVLLRPR